MQRILNRRILRDLRKNFFRYFALFLLVTLGMYMVISFIGSAENIIIGAKQAAKDNGVEDGQFSVFVPLKEENLKLLEDKGVVIESEFYLDYAMKDSSVVRVYQNRDNINRISIEEGTLANNIGEIVLEKHYAKSNRIKIGSHITIGKEDFIVTGVGSSPDYEYVLKNMSDINAECSMFGTGFVTKDQYDKLKEEGNYSKTEEYVYSYRLCDSITSKELKEMLSDFEFDISKVTDTYFLELVNNLVGEKSELLDRVSALSGEQVTYDIANLTQFIEAENNPRIGASIDEVMINKYAGIVAGIIIMGLFTYVISVFVIHGIEKESPVIGALYALGLTKKQLMGHYLMLPLIITTCAGCVGSMIGFSPLGVGVQMSSTTEYFSLPFIKTLYPAYVVIYGILMPPLVSIIVNYLVINKKLSKTALSMLRSEQKASKISKLNLGNINFIRKFQVRQFCREVRTSFTVVIGMFIALLILMIGVNCYVLCTNMSVQNKEDTKFQYMYIYKYPTPEVPQGGTACYAETLKKEVLGYNLDVTVLGTNNDNPYFDFDVARGKNKITISSSVASKYNVSVGEKLVLTDEVNEMDYAFTIDKVVPYSVGLYVFMNIDDMRSLFGQEDDYYNVVLADNKLEIDSGRLYATTTKADIDKSADVFSNNMMSMVTSMIVVSIIIFIVVMYLMIKVMIDRSAFNISLIKIFGYRPKEIKKLYLDGNFVMVAVSAIICIPLAKCVMDELYPYLVSNIAGGMDLTFTWQLYALIYIGILLCYFVINRLLVRRLKYMVPAEVLKNRE